MLDEMTRRNASIFSVIYLSCHRPRAHKLLKKINIPSKKNKWVNICYSKILVISSSINILFLKSDNKKNYNRTLHKKKQIIIPSKYQLGTY